MKRRSLLVFLSMLLYLTAVSGTTDHDGYSDIAEEEEDTTHLDYDNLHWCHSLRLTNGEATCHSPRGRAYRTTQGTRCDMRCDRGYRLIGSSSIQCMANRRWSGTSFCRNTEPPKIRCPRSRIKFADPGKLTARVSWDTPVATDTADKVLDVILVGQQPGTDFNEGANIIRYKVYDQARNRAACKFIIRVEVKRCPALLPPLHGSLACSSDITNYGSTCEYHCDAGYERRGVSGRVCQFDRNWSDDPAECVPMEIKSDVKTASALLAQFFQKRRLLILSAPNTSDPDYELQNVMIQKTDCGLELRHVTLIELVGSPPHETGRIKENNLTSQVVDELRQTFRISRSYFSMVLVDKLGLDRERFITPMASEELFSYIDSFELDEEERESLERHRDLCD
uniref:sushi repeat-containing protein SRPX2 isoform X3 n=1 Tax=Doryrhamphus excisus TaxID=161450 RepID=UPI0025AE8064|nr:sushi repeat-containing protein SRPX2 isoform X3 [Doryrhamphus excisus]